MNENDKVENNQNNTLVQSSETIIENIQNEKTTPSENEVVFSEEKVLNENNNVDYSNSNQTESDFHTIKIEEPQNTYTYISDTQINTLNNEESSINKILKENEFDFKKLLKNKWFYILLVLVISLCFFGYVMSGIINDTKPKNDTQGNLNSDKNQQQEVKPSVDENNTLVKRKIDGVLVKKEDSNYWPFATIIENSVDARPLSGVNDANIVYEALAEGSITRFLCIYDGSQKIDKIGPVRSARPYYIDIADEYSALFIHFGGSPEALDRLDKGYYNVVDMNGIIYDGKYFWRDNKRSAPHNAYTSTDLINYFKSDNDKDKIVGNYNSWQFTDKKIDETINKSYLKPAKNVYIQYSDQTSQYNLNWKYDSQNNTYDRYYENQKLDKDSLNNKITTKNIVIQFASTSVLDEKLRKEIDLTEGGKAIMIKDGSYIEGYWRKNSQINRTKFYFEINNTEQEFEFNPGKIWVNIVPKDYKIKID